MQQTSTYRWARVSDQALAWHLRRNCSVTPRQLGGWYATLCLLSLLIGSGFWVLGMPLVLAFAGPDAIGYHGDRRALVVDVYGNIEWISPDGLAIADATVLPVPEVVPHG